jgi:hypothetical protein
MIGEPVTLTGELESWAGQDRLRIDPRDIRRR